MPGTEPNNAEAVESTAVEAPEAPLEAAGGDGAADATSDPGTAVAVSQEAEEFKPSGADLVALDREDVFRAMDRADEELILDELMGRALDVMVYCFEQGGKKLTDLSYAGIAEAVRTMNARGFGHVRVSGDPPIVNEVREDGQDFYRLMVYAVDEANGGGQWGTAVEPKRMKLRAATANRRRANGEEIPEDDTVWDKFALAKALSKAQRNALKPLVPVELRQALIAQYLGDESKVKRIKAGPANEVLAELPPPLADDEAKALLAEIRGKYDVLKGYSRLKLPPAKFNSYLTQVQHDHDRMREFVAHLDQWIDEAKAAAK